MRSETYGGIFTYLCTRNKAAMAVRTVHITIGNKKAENVINRMVKDKEEGLKKLTKLGRRLTEKTSGKRGK